MYKRARAVRRCDVKVSLNLQQLLVRAFQSGSWSSDTPKRECVMYNATRSPSVLLSLASQWYYCQSHVASICHETQHPDPACLHDQLGSLPPTTHILYSALAVPALCLEQPYPIQQAPYPLTVHCLCLLLQPPGLFEYL